MSSLEVSGPGRRSRQTNREVMSESEKVLARQLADCWLLRKLRESGGTDPETVPAGIALPTLDNEYVFHCRSHPWAVPALQAD